ncbi:DNA adenine methylase [Microbacterium sp. NPDC089188]|uniref:DNA adenine methylase n=1 Tax=Microbacterium sp. NPDC089188 TaxID=3154971 RepID=UPI0034206BFC
MIQRYLGNKTRYLEHLLTTFRAHAEEGAHVVDLFSGSLSVSLAMKEAGYRVSANDANLLSNIIGEAFLVPTGVPEADLALIPERARGACFREAQAVVLSERGFAVTRAAGQQHLATRLVALTLWLNMVEQSDLAPRYRRTDFFDTYTEEGKNSGYTSSRGRSGRRRFFSSSNGKRIDVALGQVRLWSRSGAISPPVEAYLLATLMRAVERVANTQGTFHDFPRETWDARALTPLRVEAASTDPMVSPVAGHRVGREEDSREFVKTVDPHAILYLDPPYNFRQYSAYYFLLNLVCRYPSITDLDDYFSKVTFVRGQNPEDDFTSSFCSSKMFLSDMGAVMRDAQADTVVVSYYTGANHWSKFNSDRNDTGLELLRGLMTGTMFEPESFTALEVERKNYASYGGYKARTVQELILVAKKRRQSGAARTVDGRVSEVA